MAKRPRIWLTRPREDSEALAAELAQYGIESVVAPVMEIHPQAFTLPTSTPNALLLTSRHAAHALAQLPADWRALPVYCVGNATAEAARVQVFSNIIAGDADMLALLPRIADALNECDALLYLAGEEISVDVAPLLPHISVHQLTVYRADAVEILPAELDLDAVVFFSTRSAEIANRLLQKADKIESARGIEAFCISLNVAASAGQLPWKKLRASHQPTREGLRDLIVSQLTKTL